MGLDMYAFKRNKTGDMTEISYWRKHPNLHGWFEQLWEDLDKPNVNEDNSHLEDTFGTQFNGVEVFLTEKILDGLEEDVNAGTLPKTSGFFFGNDADEYYKENDLEFIEMARQAIKDGYEVFYTSSW